MEIFFFDKITGRTVVIQHATDTGDVELCNQSNYLLKMVIEQDINEENDKFLLTETTGPSCMAISHCNGKETGRRDLRMCLDLRMVNYVT
jgi:hypothetical protein